jgi:hypothetical protein
MEFTRPATWEDVKSLARLLDEAGVEYALIGGYALAAHGFSRFTEDIDILVNPSAENSRRWIMALAKLPDGAARELAAAPDVFAGGQRYAIRINDEFTVDVLPAAAGLRWEDVRPHLTTQRIDEVTIRLLDLPGLLRTKQTGRLRDQADAAVIEAALRRMK